MLLSDALGPFKGWETLVYDLYSHGVKKSVEMLNYKNTFISHLIIIIVFCISSKGELAIPI